MRFMPLVGIAEDGDFTDDYRQARALGKLRLGKERLYFRNGLHTFYIPYDSIHRYFRRIMQVPAKLCCGRGNFEIESLVICDEEKEIAQIQMPGAKAGKAAMEELAVLAPNAIAGLNREKTS